MKELIVFTYMCVYSVYMWCLCVCVRVGNHQKYHARETGGCDKAQSASGESFHS